MVTEKDNFIEIYDNVLSPHICKYIIDVFEYCDSISITHPGTIIKSSNKSNIIDTDIKESTDLNIYPLFNDDMSELIQYLPPLYPEFPDIINDVESRLQSNFQKYLDKYMVITHGFKKDMSESLGYFSSDTLIMKRYNPPNEGYHKYHQDFSPICNENLFHKRALVFMIYLNDVDDGGETQFYHQNLKIKPKEGRLVIFPTYWTHHHRGLKPISNKKYILNSWVMYN